MSDERRTDVTAGPGGVMTDEVGVVTGALTVRTVVADDLTVTVGVQYTGADEWYAVTNARAVLHDPADLDTVHAIVVAFADRPNG